MRKLLSLHAAAACCLAATPLSAATLMEFRSAEDAATQKMWIEGDIARVEGGSEPGSFTLFDLKRGRLYGVNPASKQIIEFDVAALAAPSEEAGPDEDDVPDDAPEVEVALEDEGPGPRIAGYDTRHYRLTADGQACGDYFLSKDALAEGEMRQLLSSLRSISALGRHAVLDTEPCDQAEAYAVSEYVNLGLPMRQVRADGELEQEIVQIDTQASLPPGGVELPKGYARLSMQQYIEQMMKQPPRSK